MNRFEKALSTGTVLVADGAMGTALFALGLESGGAPELLSVEQPDLIAQVHKGYVDAGADIVLTNTFGGNRRRLALHNLENRVAELNRRAVEIARGATDAIVAGSIGPTGDLMAPLGTLTQDEAVDVFREQAKALAAAGTDVLWIETMSSLEELTAAYDACTGLGVPIVATMSFDTNAHTMMGVSPAALSEWASTRDVVAVGANCGIGPGDVVAAALGLNTAGTSHAIVSKANCGIPLYSNDQLEYPTSPADMSDYVELAIRAGANIVGACCGSTPRHIAAIRHAVDSHVPGPLPDASELSDRLDAAAPRSPGRRRAGSRRR